MCTRYQYHRRTVVEEEEEVICLWLVSRESNLGYGEHSLLTNPAARRHQQQISRVNFLYWFTRFTQGNVFSLEENIHR